MKADVTGKADILIVDDTIENLQVLATLLEENGYTTRPLPSGELALDAVDAMAPDLILLDINMPEMNGYEVCDRLKAQDSTRDIPVLFISALTETVDKVKAFGVGGLDYITKPFQPEEVLARIETHLELSRLRAELEVRVRDRTAELADALGQISVLKDRLEAENAFLREDVRLVHLHGDIIGQSKGMKAVLSSAERVAPTDSIVLILGESGTGKELLARSIHEMSRRKERAMVTVNCAAMPATLVEGELFGREKGAYTGASTRQLGRFEVADGSTLFLDEVGEFPLESQAKLLRVLQEGEIERLGSSKTIRADVRVLAATNRDLAEAVEKGRFRQDLYYRLNVFPIEIPPLRERRDDIPALVWSFVTEFNQRMGRRVERIPQGCMDALTEYSWPGNVRELRNVIERAVILCDGTDLRVDLARSPVPRVGQEIPTLAEAEKRHILEVLDETGWRVRGKGGAADLLRLKPTTLESRMKNLGISRPRPG